MDGCSCGGKFAACGDLEWLSSFCVDGRKGGDGGVRLEGKCDEELEVENAVLGLLPVVKWIFILFSCFFMHLMFVSFFQNFKNKKVLNFD